MKKVSLYLFSAAALLLAARGAAQPSQGGAGQAVRPIGVVSKISGNKFTLHTDGGQDLAVELTEGATILRVPPGARDLKSAAKITPSDISVGDRVLVRGQIAADQKSMSGSTVIVMTRADIASAHVEESREWSQRGISGNVKEINSAAKELTLAVRNNPPTPGNLTHPITLALAPDAKLLRYSADSVNFSDATPGTFQDIKIGDQLRALGTKSADGTRYTAETVVSGTFRNIGATVISVDAAQGSVTVKDLSTGKPLLVKTNADSKLHRLPPFLAFMIARFNSGGGQPGGSGGPPNANAGGGPPHGGARHEGFQGGGPPGGEGKMSGTGGAGMGMGGRGGMGGQPRDFNQILARTPLLSLRELKPGDALIVVAGQGTDPSQVTAIDVLAGVEPILEARPKGSNEVVLGPWNMSVGGETGDMGP